MKRWFLRSVALGLFFVGALTGPANAQIVTYTGVDIGAGPGGPFPNSSNAAASFQAVTGETSPLTFESAPLGAFTSLVVAPGVSLSGTDYYGNNQVIMNVPSGSPANLYGFNTTPGGSQYVSVYGGFVTFTFSSPIQAFGAYITGAQLIGEAITFNDGASQSVAIPVTYPDQYFNGGTEFVGFTDAGKSITSVTISTPDDFTGVDDVLFGSLASPSATPEPASLTLLGIGIAGMAGYTWRRRKVPAV